MKKLFFLFIVSSFATACDVGDQRQKSDLPAVVEKVEVSKDDNGKNNGLYSYTMRRADGTTWLMNSYKVFKINDTLTLALDTVDFHQIAAKDTAAVKSADSVRTDSVTPDSTITPKSNLQGCLPQGHPLTF